jgi:hypothetical protein
MQGVLSLHLKKMSTEIIWVIGFLCALDVYYRVAGNVLWYKISWNCMLALQKKMSFFLYLHLLHVETTPKSIDAYNMSSCFLRFRGSYFRGTQPIREKR